MGKREKTLKNKGNKLVEILKRHGMGIAIIYYNNQ